MIRCLFRYSTNAGTSSCLWSFNPLLLRLLGETSLTLLCSHSSQGSALDLDPPLRVGCLRASVPCRNRTGLKEQLLRGLWLIQAGGREGYGCGASLRRQRLAGHCSSPRCAMPFSRGSCPWITGAWPWRAAPAPGRGGVDSDLCSHTGFLVAAAVALASHARLWGLY